jgi:hypothetical protein
MFRMSSLLTVMAFLAMMSSLVVAQEQTREEVRTVSCARLDTVLPTYHVGYTLAYLPSRIE